MRGEARGARGQVSAPALADTPTTATPGVHSDMAYAIFTYSSGEPLDTVDLHVLARAYRQAWRTLFARNPVGVHVIAALDVMFIFPAKDQSPDTDS